MQFFENPVIIIQIEKNVLNIKVLARTCYESNISMLKNFVSFIRPLYSNAIVYFPILIIFLIS